VSKKRERNKRRVKRHLLYSFIIIVIIAVVVLYTRPLPSLYPVNNISSIPASTPVISWPAGGQAAVGALHYGLLKTDGIQTPQPIASTAKLITALMVLNKYPLSVGQQGPSITITASDVAIYNQYVAEDGSVVQVVSGEQLTEYQMLEAMLLPSANNIADTLAIWAYGSLPNYTTAANQYVKTLDLTSTTIGTDASGFLPTTVSTAANLVTLGEVSMENPVIAQIVGQTQVTLPVAGNVKNVNYLLGQDNIIGIKTGNTDQAGGVYTFAANDILSPTSTVTIIGAIEGAPDLQTALSEALPLLESAETNFKLTTIVTSQSAVAHYNVPWAGSINAVSAKSIIDANWVGQPSKPVLSLHAIYAPLKVGATIGSIMTNTSPANSSVPVILQNPVPSAPWWWRIIRHKL
jgi:D-alanyl-D-alanine carboxypeptidase (penicillin-binding protein 5/6)